MLAYQYSPIQSNYKGHKRYCPLAPQRAKRPRLFVPTMSSNVPSGSEVGSTTPMLSLSMRRSKPKRLSLSLPSSPDETSPYTPGPPRTPHLHLKKPSTGFAPIAPVFEHYIDGPREIVPGVWLGDQNSPFFWDLYASQSKRVRIINVAQEIEDPFGSKGGSSKVKLAEYKVERTVDYCHLRWSHNEDHLAEVSGTLDDLAKEVGESSSWGMWEAIRWMEVGRRRGDPVLIHCQLGISRSATLSVAYVMTLAAAGVLPDRLGRIATMTDAYEFVKKRAPAIGPNNSLVFLLVEFGRNLTSLLSEHPVVGPTAWPTKLNTELSEAEWARRREQFGDELSPVDLADEAGRLDREMALRAGFR